MYGFFGKQISRTDHTMVGQVLGPDRIFVLRHAVYPQMGDVQYTGKWEYDPANGGSPPDEQALISGTDIPYTGDFRMKITNNPLENSGNNSIESLFKRADTYRRFVYNSTASVGSKVLKERIYRPQHINAWGIINWPLPINIYLPYLPNCIHIIFSSSADTSLRNIYNAFPNRLQYARIDADQGASPGLETIQYPLPATTLGLLLATGSNSFGTTTKVNDLLAQCSNMKHLLFTIQNTVFNFNQRRLIFQSGASIDIGHMTQLETLQMDAANLTNITYGFTTIKNLFLWTATALNTTTFKAIADICLATSDYTYFNIGNSLLVWTRDIVNADISTSAILFAIHNNRFTGTVTITTSKPSMVDFHLGDRADLLTAANKNDFATVDVTGLTNANVIDLSNASIDNLTLPVNTVCTELYLGGNELDVTVLTNLVSQITAMSALTNIELFAGNENSITAGETYGGQGPSTNGFGNNLDISALTNLTRFVSAHCKLTGTIKLPTSIATLYLVFEGVTGIDTGTLTNITTFRTPNSTSFVFDYTRIPNCVIYIFSGDTSQVTFDINNRSATTRINRINAQGCVLTSVTFPASSANGVILHSVSAASATINFYDNTGLTTITNLENLSFNTLTLTGDRQFHVYNCSLNQDLKIGINNWLPSNIRYDNNSMSIANVDLNLWNQIDNRTKWNTTVHAKTLNVAGTNGIPTGTYAAPTGYRTHTALTVTAVTKANPGVVTVSAIGTVANGDIVYFYDVVGMTELNGNYYLVSNLSGSTFELETPGAVDVDTTAYGTLTGSTGRCRPDGDLSGGTDTKAGTYTLVTQYGWTITQN